MAGVVQTLYQSLIARNLRGFPVTVDLVKHAAENLNRLIVFVTGKDTDYGLTNNPLIAGHRHTAKHRNDTDPIADAYDGGIAICRGLSSMQQDWYWGIPNGGAGGLLETKLIKTCGGESYDKDWRSVNGCPVSGGAWVRIPSFYCSGISNGANKIRVVVYYGLFTETAVTNLKMGIELAELRLITYSDVVYNAEGSPVPIVLTGQTRDNHSTNMITLDVNCFKLSKKYLSSFFQPWLDIELRLGSLLLSADIVPTLRISKVNLFEV